jgi:DNA-binding response OmpR family regulator
VRILLIEDEPELALATTARLQAEGFVVDHFGSLGEGIEAVLMAQYRAILLDRRLPDGDGLSLLPVLKTRADPAPVILLTAMDDIPDRVEGLEAGAEDYLIKPYAFDELLARLRVLLRRGGAAATIPLVKVGQLEYDLGARALAVGGTTLLLPRRELSILDVLIRRAGRVVMREHLEAQVYGFDDDISSNALEAHISRLRKRLADAGADVVVHGVRGVGYMIRAA